MGHVTLRIADAEIDLGLAEPDRLQLRMDVGHMDQRDIAEILERQQLLLGESLLGSQPGEIAEARNAHDRRRGHRGL